MMRNYYHFYFSDILFLLFKDFDGLLFIYLSFVVEVTLQLFQIQKKNKK